MKIEAIDVKSFKKALDMNIPSTNLGQSNLQDAFFVVGAQCTSFRKLRQVQLEMRSLEDAIKHGEFTTRKNAVKLKALGDSELEQIEREEIEWSNVRASELLNDAKTRLAQFELMLKQVLDSEQEEYWAQGYEAAETEYWPQYFGKKMALEVAYGGQPSMQTAEQIMLLPDDMKAKVVSIMCSELPKLASPEHRAALLKALT